MGNHFDALRDTYAHVSHIEKRIFTISYHHIKYSPPIIWSIQMSSFNCVALMIMDLWKKERNNMTIDPVP